MRDNDLRTPSPDAKQDPKQYLRKEWLVTNGLGGYSSGTLIGVMTRKYHGLLVSAFPPPHGRYIMLNHLKEEIVVNGKHYLLNCEENLDGSLNIDALSYLKEFYLEDGLPNWKYELDGVTILKYILMPHRQNTVLIKYQLLGGADMIRLVLYPAFNFRNYETDVNIPLDPVYSLTIIGNRYEISKRDFTPVRLFTFGDSSSTFMMDQHQLHNVFFRGELWRGYESRGALWNPGYFQLDIKKHQKGGLLASTEEWSNIDALNPYHVKHGEQLRRRLLLNLANQNDPCAKELILAADQFIIVPEHRIEDAVRAHAFGEEVRTIIAGYHWFNDWGRDTMISLEGLTLCTKRYREARWILKTFASYVKNGLIPNMFPDRENKGLYHTADATLWFFHAIDRFISTTQDPLIIQELLLTLEEIMHYHIHGTQFGIGMDQNDKLLKQGMEKYQLTWMDAKVEDWVVTPRRGKAVEINALWYNALKLMEEWSTTKKELYGQLAQQVYISFNKRFWIAEEGYLYDVIDGETGNDNSFRPNQLFAISLKYPVLENSKWTSVVEKVKEKLLTPCGLRTLDPAHPDFKAYYEGDIRARDAAYHQGTVWPWLIGPFCDAWLKIHPNDFQSIRYFLIELSNHLNDAAIGTISEICDALPPFTPKGCIAQAWSVAEVLRQWLKTL